jgi:hypothetical protein
LIGKVKATRQMLKDFKAVAFGDIEAFIDLSLEQYGAHVAGNKGNITLYSFDGQFKIVRQIQDSIRFDERLQAAKVLIDECIQSWSVGSNDHIKTLINDAFQVDREGKISTGRVLGLRRHKIDDRSGLKQWKPLATVSTLLIAKVMCVLRTR